MKFQGNCMGYAFGIEDWLRPFRKWTTMYVAPSSKNRLQRVKESIQTLTSTYNLKRVRVNTKLKENTKYIFYREAEYDFHFIVRTEKGHFYHKRGATSISRISAKDVWANVWHSGKHNDPHYNSRLIIFEVLQ